MRKWLYYISMILLFTGCSEKSDEFSLYHEDGRAKPVVVITPVIDSTSYEVPWSLAEEFTDTIVNKLAQKGVLYLPEDNKHHSHVSKNPFGTDIDWIKNHYSNAEFVVFLELVKHRDEHVKKNEEPIDVKLCSHDLNISMRVRAVDLRGNKPKVILQELVKSSYYISKNVLHTDYDIVVWGVDEYLLSPMGLAHQSFSKEIADRISDYVLLAKSR